MAIEANICRSDGKITRTCFGPAQHLCYTALRLHYFPLFRQSDLFFKFLSGWLFEGVPWRATNCGSEAAETVSLTDATFL